MIRLIWGPSSYALYQPLGAAGTVDVGALVLSGYDIGLVVLAAVLAIGASFALKHTRWGRLLTVVIFDRELAAAFGINVTLVYTITFVIGAMLGALALDPAVFAEITGRFVYPAYERLGDDPPALGQARRADRGFDAWMGNSVANHKVPGYAIVTLSLLSLIHI